MFIFNIIINLNHCSVGFFVILWDNKNNVRVQGGTFKPKHANNQKSQQKPFCCYSEPKNADNYFFKSQSICAKWLRTMSYSARRDFICFSFYLTPEEKKLGRSEVLGNELKSAPLPIHSSWIFTIKIILSYVIYWSAIMSKPHVFYTTGNIDAEL